MKLTIADDADLRRVREYPAVQVQLNMIWKALGELKSKAWSSDVQAMINQLAAVDAKYPKS